MINSKAALIAGGLGVLLFGGFWLGLNRKDSASTEGKAAPAAPPNLVHEKATLEDQLRATPGHPPILLRLAQVASEQGQPAEARRRLEELLKADPTHLEARLELGRACYELNDLTCATSETERILQVDPNHADALYNLGAIYANVGQTDKARLYWSKAAKAAPSSDSGKKAAAALQKLGG